MKEDYTGLNPTHKIEGEVILLENIKNKTFALGKGAFFSESVVLRQEGSATPMTRIAQYKPRVVDAAATGHSAGKPIHTLIELTEEPTTNLVVDYQYVGGKHIEQIETINRLIAAEDMLGIKNILFSQLLNRPTTMDVTEDHLHDASSITGKEEEIAALVTIGQSIEQMAANLVMGEENEIWHQINVMYRDMLTKHNTVVDKAAEVDQKHAEVLANAETVANSLSTKADLLDGSVVLPSLTEEQLPDVSDPTIAAKALIHFNTKTGKAELWNPATQRFGAIGGGGVGNVLPVITADTTINVGDMAPINLEANKDNVRITITDDEALNGDNFAVGIKGKGLASVYLRSSSGKKIMEVAEDFEFDTDYTFLNFALIGDDWTIISAFNDGSNIGVVKDEIKGTFPAGTKTFNLDNSGDVMVFINKNLTFDYTNDGRTIELTTALAGESEVYIIAYNNVDLLDIEGKFVRMASGKSLEETHDDFAWLRAIRDSADFANARREMCTTHPASSFLTMGRHHEEHVKYKPINEGLFAGEGNTVNTVRMGRAGHVSGTAGKSSTDYPLTLIGGLISHLTNINNTAQAASNILFDAAPKGLVISDKYGCRGTDKPSLNLIKDIDPKYGDVASTEGEARARAFEGLVKNGDFRNGTSGWTRSAGSITDRGDYVTFSGDTGHTMRPAEAAAVGKNNDTYIVDVILMPTAGTLRVDFLGVNTVDGHYIYTSSASDLNKMQKISYKGNFNQDVDLAVEFVLTSPNTSVDIYSVSIRRATEEVVVNRVDMWGFEFFLEEVTKAKPYVYYGGCIQSIKTDILSIPTSTSLRRDTYYEVFSGCGSRGKGIDFWAASAADKLKLVSLPEMNLFNLGDDLVPKICQWRVRQRTEAGVGNGVWYNTDASNNSLEFYGGNGYVKPQGSSDEVSTNNDLVGTPDGLLDYYLTLFNPTTRHEKLKEYLGVFTAARIIRDSAGSSLGVRPVEEFGVDGECYFLVCGRVPRLNTGAYHPSFNPLGSAEVEQIADSPIDLPWNTADRIIRSTYDAFRYAGPQANGSITSSASSAKNGRPDNRYYDIIYHQGMGGMIDDRLPCYDSGTKAREDEIKLALISSTYLGEELMDFTWIDVVEQIIGGEAATSISTSLDATYRVGDKVSLVMDGTTDILVTANVIGVRAGAVDIDGSFERIAGPSHVVVTTKSNIPVSGYYLRTDLVSSPERIMREHHFKEGWLGGWIQQIPDGAKLGRMYQLTKRQWDDRPIWCQQTRIASPAWVSMLPWSSLQGWQVSKNVFGDGSGGSLFESDSLTAVSYTAFAAQIKEDERRGAPGAGIDDVYVQGGYWSASWGGALPEVVVGRCAACSNGGTGGKFYRVTDYTVRDSGKVNTGSSYDNTKHSKIDIPAPNNAESGAFKALIHRFELNGAMALQLHVNELRAKIGNDAETAYEKITSAGQDASRNSLYFLPPSIAQGSLPAGRYVCTNNFTTVNWTDTRWVRDVNGYWYADNLGTDPLLKEYTSSWGDKEIVLIGKGTYVNLNNQLCRYNTFSLTKHYGYTWLDR